MGDTLPNLICGIERPFGQNATSRRLSRATARRVHPCSVAGADAPRNRPWCRVQTSVRSSAIPTMQANFGQPLPQRPQQRLQLRRRGRHVGIVSLSLHAHVPSGPTAIVDSTSPASANFAVTTMSPSSVTRPPAIPRRTSSRGSAPRAPRTMRWQPGPGGLVTPAVVVFNGDVGSWSSGLSLTSSKPEVCGGCGCVATRTSASGCSSTRPAAISGCCCAA